MKMLALVLSLALLPLAANASVKVKTGSTTATAKGKKAGAESSASFKVDTTASLAKWEGKKLGGAHQGELKFKSGSLAAKDGMLTGGELVIDMTTLKDNDQEGEMNAKLVNHLKSDDFFSVEKNPTSTLKITNVEKDGVNSKVTGNLTIKGITKPVSFPAVINVDKNKLTAQGTMTVDRTMFDIKFRSLKFFANIGDKVIKDEFTVAFDITATK